MRATVEVYDIERRARCGTSGKEDRGVMDGEELFVGESVTGNVTKMEVYAALGREQAAEIIERIVAQGREDVSSRMREMAERGENARSLFRFCFLAEKVADL